MCAFRMLGEEVCSKRRFYNPATGSHTFLLTLKEAEPFLGKHINAMDKDKREGFCPEIKTHNLLLVFGCSTFQMTHLIKRNGTPATKVFEDVEVRIKFTKQDGNSNVIFTNMVLFVLDS